MWAGTILSRVTTEYELVTVTIIKLIKSFNDFNFSKGTLFLQIDGTVNVELYTMSNVNKMFQCSCFELDLNKVCSSQYISKFELTVLLSLVLQF